MMGYQSVKSQGLALEDVLVNLCTKSGMSPHPGSGTGIRGVRKNKVVRWLRMSWVADPV